MTHPLRWRPPVVLLGLLVLLLLLVPAAVSAQTGAVVEEGQGELITDREITPVAPGVRLETFDRLNESGWIRAFVLQVELDRRSVSSGLLFPGEVAEAEPLSNMARRRGAIAGVNGDFFDINATNAPLGAMVDDGELVKGSSPGHPRVAGVGEDRLGRLAELVLEGTVTLPGGERALASLNQSSIPAGGIGLFTPLWGEAARTRAVEGATLVREVRVRNGRVISVAEEAGEGDVPRGEQILVGREAGAEALAGLEVGDAVRVAYRPRTTAPEPFEWAVGGNITLVSDGVLQEVDDAALAPRTAVGFSEDGETMFLAAVDGRQVDSRGMTLRELGDLMLDLGSDDALNLDGGGSTTLVAREPGELNPDVENNPSDGQERPVPNGIGVFARAGSGQLRDLRIEPRIESEEADEPVRAFPGLTRRFRALGYDEVFSPARAENVRWAADPGSLGSFRGRDGVFQARRPGRGAVEAFQRGAGDRLPVRVLGPLVRIEADQTRVGLADAEATRRFRLIGYDAEGYSAPIEPDDVELGFDAELVEIEAGDDGFFEASARAERGAGRIRLTVDPEGRGRFDPEPLTAELPLTVGLDDTTVADFENAADWRFSQARAAGSISAAEGRTGQGLQVSYDFTQSTGTRAAYASPPAPIELTGEVQRIGLWVKGDGNGAWLRMSTRDSAGTAHTLDLVRNVTWTDWRYVEAVVPAGIEQPLRVERIYAVETVPARQYTGTLVYDDLVARTTPSAAGEGPGESPEGDDAGPAEDPVIVTNGALEPGRWRFAVLSDAQFVAQNPDSDQVRAARAGLRQIVAADPDFLVLNGDFVDTGYPEDFELAQRILDEEIGDRFPVFYVPGNHEILGPGNLDNFREAFGANRRTFDWRDTRFFLLDSSAGSFRTSDFEQLLDLRRGLEEAADDPDVENVVVMAHHPTNDPLPTDNSQLGDRKEVELLEEWLTEFRESSGGKGVAYLSSHAQNVNVNRVDGVPYMVLPPVGKGAYGSPESGGFNGWALFGVDPSPVRDNPFRPDPRPRDPRRIGSEQWLRAEVRPMLDEIVLEIPGTLERGETVPVEARGEQPSGASIPLRYPATVRWSGSRDLFVGSGPALERARRSGRYVALFDPRSLELTGVRRGEVTLRVEANGRAAERQIAVRAQETAERPDHVILVDWDGFDPDYLGRVPTPNLDALTRRGSLSVAEGTYRTISNPSRASMSTGAYPEVHGNEAYYYDEEADRAMGQSRFLAAETIAEALAAEGKNVASVQWYMVQNHGVTYGDPDHLYVQPGGPFERRVDAAIDILNRRPVDSNGTMVTVPRIPELLAVYSSDLDGLGHDEGPNSPNIAPMLAEHDRQLGRLIQATKDVGIYEETAFILTSDHGMTEWSRTLIPDVLDAVSAAGYTPEIVSSGRTAAPESDVLIQPNSVRTADISLRGAAATAAGRRAVRAALESLEGKITRVLDEPDLERLRVSDKLGELVAEAEAPWGFALSEPEEGERGSHGSLAEMEVPLLLAGAGVRRGFAPRNPGLVDVAPTISALLGVRAPADAQGRALSESLSPLGREQRGERAAAG